MAEQQDARRMLDQAERAATAGDLASAGEFLKDAARIQEEELGPLHPDLANTLNNLAIVAERTGSSSEAETLYRRAAAIAAAALPSAHPMVVASRQNLEDFCCAHGLWIDAPAPIVPTRDTERELNASGSKHPAEADKTPVRPVDTGIIPRAATVAVVLVAAVLLVLRPWSSRDAPAPVSKAEPTAAQPAEAMPPRIAAPPVRPAQIEQARPPPAAPPRDGRPVATHKAPAANGVTVATAQLCRAISTSGTRWRCDPAGHSTAPGPIIFYTRVRSLRDTAVVHRWYHGDTLRQSVMLGIKANGTEGYRTYSRLTVDGGNWRLEVRSADGNLLYEERFAVR